MFEVNFHTGVESDIYESIIFYINYREQKIIREALGQDPNCRFFINRLKSNINYNALQQKFGTPNKCWNLKKLKCKIFLTFFCLLKYLNSN